jgi:hypothetical protein
MTAEQVARKCRCSKGTVINRLKSIREKTRMEPDELRRFSSQFDKIEDDIRESKAAYIHRKRLAAQNLVTTNTAGVIAIRLTCPTDPGENTIVRDSAPVSQGRETCRDFRVLGTCPAPVAGSSDITGLYTARYGVPPVAKKVYIQVNQFVDGWESRPVSFGAIVPATA